MDDIIDSILSSQPTVIDDDEGVEEAGMSEGEHEGDGTDVPRAVRALQLLTGAGITVSELLSDVFMGDQAIRSAPIIVNARTEVFDSGVLPEVATRVCRPPDMRIRGKAHINAANTLEEWTLETTGDLLRCELATHAKSTKVGDVEREVVNEESLKELTFDATAEEVQKNAPRLYNTLMKICESPRQEKNTQKVLTRPLIHSSDDELSMRHLSDGSRG
ncbi:hypothetical protein RSAG8_01461, partial [Rhizoctonia solani AG-8 WAC10335]